MKRKDAYNKQWHMGFYGAIELEFRNDRKYLEFLQEYQLSKKSLSVDMLVIRKEDEVQLNNSIGKIFRRHNIIEYKSPRDQLGIDQFYKGISYVCLYKSLGRRTDDIKADQITLTFIREGYPKKLIKHLNELGCVIEKNYPGIYYVSKNLLFPVQIVVTKELESREHRSLRVLSDNVDIEDAKAFVKAASLYDIKVDRDNAEALLQISVKANSSIFDRIKEEDNMCDALKELMKDEIEEEKIKAAAEGLAEGREKGLAEGRAEGRAEGERFMIASMLKNGKTPQAIAEFCKYPIDVILKIQKGLDTEKGVV